VVIWFPLLLISANPGDQPNYVQVASLAASIRGWPPFYTSQQSYPEYMQRLNQSTFAQLRREVPSLLASWVAPPFPYISAHTVNGAP
jgi:hypothetical protein